MDIAIYCHAGRKEGIVANVFDGYPEERRNSMNPHLQCPACGAPAHFRRKSCDGKDPCFVAQHESGLRHGIVIEAHRRRCYHRDQGG